MQMYLHYVFVTFNTFHKRDFMNCILYRAEAVAANCVLDLGAVVVT